MEYLVDGALILMVVDDGQRACTDCLAYVMVDWYLVTCEVVAVAIEQIRVVGSLIIDVQNEKLEVQLMVGVDQDRLERLVVDGWTETSVLETNLNPA